MADDRVKISNPTPSVTDFKELLEESRKLAQTGCSADALKVLDQAEQSVLSNTDNSDVERDLQLSRININRGITFKNMRALEKSAKCYEEAMRLLKSHEEHAPRERFSAELNLAVLRMRLKDRKKALTGFEKAEKLALKFNDPDKKDLIRKVLTNKAKLHLEFQEIDKARNLLGKLASEYDRFDNDKNREKNARVSAQLGLMIAQLADNEANRKLAKEHYHQAERFFDEAIQIYNDLNLTRDAH